MRRRAGTPTPWSAGLAVFGLQKAMLRGFLVGSRVLLGPFFGRFPAGQYILLEKMPSFGSDPAPRAIPFKGTLRANRSLRVTPRRFQAAIPRAIS
jgi:hypothetical protein